ncbi:MULTISPECIES: hypothetical protein [unclassified Streptomyces]|uniref:hypothetical protein n=1 Tax=unclassified Streptomyces TaxID=2593676 RepID=UPI0035D7C6ED
MLVDRWLQYHGGQRGMLEVPERSEIEPAGQADGFLVTEGVVGQVLPPHQYGTGVLLHYFFTKEDERKAMALKPQHIVDRLFEQIEAEYFDFTITVSDSGAPERWLQLRGNSINVPYPHNGPPEEVLLAFDIFGNLPWDVDSWEAGRYVTVDWGPSGKATEPMGERLALAAVLTRMLENYLGLPVDSEQWVIVEE